MLPLNDPRWAELRHAYGRGDEIAAWLRSLRTGFSSEVHSSDQHPWDSLCHQWTVYPATFAAIPHIVDIVAEHPPEERRRVELLSFVGWSIACAQLSGDEPPSFLASDYAAGVRRAVGLIVESLPYAELKDDDSYSPAHRYRILLSSLAACHGAYELALILAELKDGAKCSNCQTWFKPLESSMNPFWQN
jgi:hypothetical protein